MKLGIFEDSWVTENVESGFPPHGDVERTLYGFYLCCSHAVSLTFTTRIMHVPYLQLQPQYRFFITEHLSC